MIKLQCPAVEDRDFDDINTFTLFAWAFVFVLRKKDSDSPLFFNDFGGAQQIIDSILQKIVLFKCWS